MFVRCLKTAELTVYVQVIDYDDAAPSVTLKTGEKHYADVVVAVDGTLPCSVYLSTSGLVYVLGLDIVSVSSLTIQPFAESPLTVMQQA